MRNSLVISQYIKACMAGSGASQYSDDAMSSEAEERIAELCSKVVSTPESSPEFDAAVRELRAALHESALWRQLAECSIYSRRCAAQADA